MTVKDLIKLLRNVPPKSPVEMAVYNFGETGADSEPRGFANIVDVEHCECCGTVKIVGVLTPEESELDELMEEALKE
jgi:hypothetical protein